MKQPRSCGFLIVRGNPVDSFLLMEHTNRWDLPKGHVDPGESDLECALRELEEETGIAQDQLEIDTEFLYETRYIVNGQRYGEGDESIEKTMLIFLGRLMEDVEIEVTEHIGYKWFNWKPPHKVQKRAIDPLLKAVEKHFAE